MENSSRDGNTRPPDLLLRNLYAGQEATVRTGHETTDWFQIRKGAHQGYILPPLFNLYKVQKLAKLNSMFSEDTYIVSAKTMKQGMEH